MTGRQTVKLPKMGDTVDQVLVIGWVVAPGDDVRPGDVLLRVETDKVDADVPTSVGGTVEELLVEPGTEVTTGAPICVIRPRAEGRSHSVMS